MKNRYLIGMLAVLLLGFAGSRTVLANEEPAPGVARISLIHGDVSTMRGDSGDWVATTVNAPLVRGDKIATGDQSRAEVQLDYANVLRLDQRAEVNIVDVTRTRLQLQVAQGTVTFTVFKGTEADVEIATPNMAVHPLGEGSYRIQVNSPSDTQVMVHNGRAEVSTAQGSATVEKNQAIYVRGTDNPEYQVANAEHNDEWDNWNRDRDNSIRDAQSWSHTNQYYTGANDLDRNGRWVNVPDYDWCWTPYVNAGWVPYRDGRWVWEPYYGWTWVSYEPWGWAPYHYGRWFMWNNAWCWWPGYVGRGYYPMWSPAWVSFMGFGFGGRHWGFGFGYGFGSIGWLPLGPRDHFNPWWGRGHSYNVVNITNITNVNNINSRTFGRRVYGSNFQAALTNERVRGAITTVSAQDFASGRIPRNPRAIDANTLRQAGVVNGTLPVVPNRQSLQSVNRPVNRGSLPSAAGNGERFFSRRTAPARPAPFAQQATAVQQMVQTHNPLAAGSVGAAGTSRAGVNRPMGMTTPEANTGRAASELGRQSATPGPQAGGNRAVTGGATPGTAAGERPGWQRFGSGRPAPSTGTGPQAPLSTGTARDRRPAAVNVPGSSGRSWSAPSGGGRGGSAPSGGGHSASGSRGGGHAGGRH